MKSKLLKSALLLAFFAPLCAGTAQAKKDVELRHDSVTVAAQDIMTEDILTDGAITVDGKLSANCTALGGPIIINGRVEGDVASLGGPVSIPGSVLGDVSAVGQSVEISGSVNGDVSVVGGNIVLKDSAAVIGNISTIGGHVERGGSVVIKGKVDSTDLKMLGRMMPQLIKSGLHGNGDGLKALLLGGALGLAGLAILSSVLVSGLLLFLIPPIFFHKNVETAASAIKKDFWRCAGFGTLIALLLAPAFVSLVISIVGIPLIPLALILLLVSGILGFSAFASVLAERFFEGIKKPVPASLLKRVGMGYLLTAGLLFFGRLIPFVGGILALAAFMISSLGILLALGSVFTTRMGTELKIPTPVPQQLPPQA